MVFTLGWAIYERDFEGIIDQSHFAKLVHTENRVTFEYGLLTSSLPISSSSFFSVVISYKACIMFCMILQCLSYLISCTLFAEGYNKSFSILEMVCPVVIHMTLFVYINYFLEEKEEEEGKKKVSSKHFCIECKNEE
jgi:hypothetical protein